MSFSLHPDIDADELASRYARDGRVMVEPFLAPGAAEELYQLLRNRGDWKQIVNSGDKLFEFDRRTQKSLTAEQRAQLDESIYANARKNFQYRYETIRVPDEPHGREEAGDAVADYATFLSSGECRELLRKITGSSDIVFADAQATAYSPGDFLTSHDDDVAGKARVAAHVLSLCPEWQIEWGGLFMMHEASHGTAQAVIPGFNRLNLFRVPQMHSVSEVTRASPYRRYSITGWLRASKP